jgi:hypothetical protein
MDRESNSDSLKPEIKIIRLSELMDFIGSDFFSMFSYVPITPSRAQSYIKNPFGQPDDVVLIIIYMNNCMIAFRSLFAGMAETGSERIRFGWCSGNWVHPEYRFRGFSLLLLEKAYTEWNGKLMFTNYAPESEMLYIKSGLFHEIHRFNGARGYLYLKKHRLRSIAPKKQIPAFLFSPAVFFITVLAKLRCFFFKSRLNKNLQFEELHYPDKQCYQFMQKQEGKFLFPRNENEWHWIFQYQWISDSNSDLKSRYPFSSCSESFFYQTIKIIEGSEIVGFFIFSVREGHLKTLFFNLKSGLEQEAVNYLKLYSVRKKIEMITVYNNEVARILLKDKAPFIYVKNTGQKIYSSFEIPDSGSFAYRDGEGDYGFT